MAGKAGHRGFGSLRKLPSGRWQASYTGPDRARHNAPQTFVKKMYAEGWLRDEAQLIDKGEDWTPPNARQPKAAKGPTLNTWFEIYLRSPKPGGYLRPSTVDNYRRTYALYIAERFGDVPLTRITRRAVEAWHASLVTTPGQRSASYRLLRALLNDAVDKDELAANLCVIRGAGRKSQPRLLDPASPTQIAAVVDNMPVEWRSLVLVAAWCGLRMGETLELRRKDIAAGNGITRIKVRRAVGRIERQWIIGPPKSAAGIRDVVVPPHIVPALLEHLEAIPAGPETLLWPSTTPGTHLHSTVVRKAFVRACDEAGVPQMRLHDLRHVGATLAAQGGATVKELMARIGHSTPTQAMAYQHAAPRRDVVNAGNMSEMALAEMAASQKANTAT